MTLKVGDKAPAFEAKDQDAALALLARVEGWARALGRRAVRGSVNLSLNHSAGFVIDVFGADPFVMMPYNPRYYVDLVLDAGFTKAKDLLAFGVKVEESPTERLDRVARAFRRSSEWWKLPRAWRSRRTPSSFSRRAETAGR